MSEAVYIQPFYCPFCEYIYAIAVPIKDKGWYDYTASINTDGLNYRMCEVCEAEMEDDIEFLDMDNKIDGGDD